MIISTEEKFNRLQRAIKDNQFDEDMKLLNDMELSNNGIIELQAYLTALIEIGLFERNEMVSYLETEYNFVANVIL